MTAWKVIAIIFIILTVLLIALLTYAGVQGNIRNYEEDLCISDCGRVAVFYDYDFKTRICTCYDEDAVEVLKYDAR